VVKRQAVKISGMQQWQAGRANGNCAYFPQLLLQRGWKGTTTTVKLTRLTI